jgi:2',3'-cyclic-nucleotide 2'-phosphodiesterase (5'-nucleotidase family)
MCSAGDFYGGADEFNEPKSHFVARMMGYFGYDAIAVGEMDLNYGLDKLREDNEKYHLHLTCANLVSKTQAGAENPDAEDGVWRSLQQQLNTAFPPYLVVERDGVRFGFVGLLSPELKSRVAGSRGGEVEAMTYTIKDPWEVAPTVLMEARAESDVLVLLAHMDRFDLEMKLPDYPEVDLVVLGHNPKSSSNPEPVYIGAVPVYSATSQGQNVGNLRLALDSDMTIVDTNNKVRFLGDEVPAIAESTVCQGAAQGVPVVRRGGGCLPRRRLLHVVPFGRVRYLHADGARASIQNTVVAVRASRHQLRRLPRDRLGRARRVLGHPAPGGSGRPHRRTMRSVPRPGD